MNRLKGVRPGIFFLTSLMIGIALFSIYSFSFDKIPNTSTADVKAEQQREQFMAATEDQYTTSRGEVDRLAETKPVVQAAPTAEKPAAPAEVKPSVPAVKPKAAPAVKPAAPAAPSKPAAQSKPVAKPVSQYQGEVDVLSRLIMAEAQGEPYEAKVAVGAVVINRVQSGQWADTVRGVIYQKSGGYYQFTPVQNGWIDKPADTECIRAAKAALNGADPTNGAQFYYDDKVTNEWILAKPVSIRIGHMIYAY